jgi:hypothetical protein
MTKVNTTAMAVGLLLMAAGLTLPTGVARAQRGGTQSCLGGTLAQTQDGSDDLIVKGTVKDGVLVPLDCQVGAGIYKFRDVRILDRGILRFTDAKIEFWAANILVENGGSLIAGSDKTPIGTQDLANVVTIKLYGADQTCQDAKCQSPKPGTGIKCLSDSEGRCGVPKTVWESNTIGGDSHNLVDPTKARKISDLGVDYIGVKDDYFYPYHSLPRDDADMQAYFGYKVLGVSYGGTLQLFGKKGATYATAECGETAPTTSGTSWARLNATAKAGTSTLRLDRKVNLRDGDQIVVTTTDYLPATPSN